MCFDPVHYVNLSKVFIIIRAIDLYLVPNILFSCVKIEHYSKFERH